MSASTTAERADGRERIVACALELLHRDHPDDLSIREVSRRAGVSSGTPYHHFGDKAGLLAACARVGWADLTTRIRAVDRDDPIAAQLRQIAHAYFDFALANPGCYRLMMSRLFHDAARFGDLDTLRAEAMGEVTSRIPVPDAPPADPIAAKSRAMGLWSMLHGYATLRLDGAVTGEPDPDAQLSALADLFVRVALLPPQD
ncbi:TetR/AcrR family transcriptional regulator [Microbacterium schleiferi]|uniref:TetR/AcrR family transcriptional regulator n=1 Tax=Microbacterium schleiferi TaxID=69362 RepID=A0A7S8RGS1_9MICO|nr:TetR/AcrR family transcriptional regulator [Microbacterium schleiferi]QPE03662.1 TetR/AcrR family transcriptional regulator [Microbacterium schleiferi]